MPMNAEAANRSAKLRTWLAIGIAAAACATGATLGVQATRVLWLAGDWWLALFLWPPVVHSLFRFCLAPAVWLRPELFSAAVRRHYRFKTAPATLRDR